MVVDTLFRAAAPEIGKRILGEGAQKLTRESLQQGTQKLTKESLEQGIQPQVRNIDNIMKNLNPETPKRFPEFLDDSDIEMMGNRADTHPQEVEALLKDFESMVEDPIRDDGSNFAGGLLKMDQATKNQDSIARAQAPPPSKEPIAPEVKNNFTVSEKNLAPDIEGADLASEVAEATRIHEEFKPIQQSGKKLGEKELSIGSTIGPIDQKKSFNLSPIEKAETVPRAVGETNIKETPGKRGVRREITSEIEDIPYKELHHIFGKAPGEKIISNAWRLIEAGKATVDDLINLNRWAKHYSVGMGDYGAEAVNRVPHSRTHSRSRAFKREMSAKEIKEIPEFDNIDDLTSYFREQLETRTIPMRGELDIQQGIYDLLPKKTKIEVEQLKVAKEKASRSLTDRYKKIYGETMPDTPPEVKDAYQTHIWIQQDLDVTDSKLIKFAEELDQARLAQDMTMTKVATQLEKLEAEELASLDRKAIKTGRPGKETSARAQEKIDYSQVRNETDPYEMMTGKESFWEK